MTDGRLPMPADASPEVLGPVARRGLALGMLAVHAAAAWALLQWEPVREAVGTVAPIFVDWIAPPVPPPPSEAPLPAPAKTVEPPRPRPVIAAAPAPLAEAPAFVAPAPPPEPPAPEAIAAAPTPAPAAPSPPPPAPVAVEPKTIPATAVEYLSPPVLSYPSVSQRRGEQGRVLVRVLVDVRGLPQQMAVAQSSGFGRLDEAAIATVRATRFKPYTENGVAQPFWVLMPLVFELRP